MGSALIYTEQQPGFRTGVPNVSVAIHFLDSWELACGSRTGGEVYSALDKRKFDSVAAHEVMWPL